MLRTVVNSVMNPRLINVFLLVRRLSGSEEGFCSLKIEVSG